MTDGNVTLSIPSAYTHPATHPASMITGLATVATSGSYNDLSNKPSIPATPNAYVTATYQSGSTWYRKWSDGWVEQGGRISPSSSKNQYTVSFPLSMANTNYTFSITEGRDSDTTGAFPLSRMKSCSTSSMVVALQNLTSSYGGASWMVVGKGA